MKQIVSGQLYNDLYENYMVKQSTYINYVRDTLIKYFSIERFPTSSEILIIGCGMGSEFDLLISKGFRNITGMDMSEETVKKSRHKGKIIIQDCTLRNDQLKKQYDVILINGLLHHIDSSGGLDNLFFNINNYCHNNSVVLIREPIPSFINKTLCYICQRDLLLRTIICLRKYLPQLPMLTTILSQYICLAYEVTVILKWFSIYKKDFLNILRKNNFKVVWQKKVSGNIYYELKNK